MEEEVVSIEVVHDCSSAELVPTTGRSSTDDSMIYIGESGAHNTCWRMITSGTIMAGGLMGMFLLMGGSI